MHISSLWSVPLAIHGLYGECRLPSSKEEAGAAGAGEGRGADRLAKGGVGGTRGLLASSHVEQRRLDAIERFLQEVLRQQEQRGTRWYYQRHQDISKFSLSRINS